uniref:Uncharacterized protein n=1 Tax=Trichuris muris TaxID=70415 RepID=A0A5S6QJ43_TRIMR
MGISSGVDFEAFVTMDDELVTSNEPDEESIFQAVLSDVQEMNASADDLEEESDNDTEVGKTQTDDDVRHSLHHLKLFVAEKCPDMFNAIVNAHLAFTTYVCTIKAKQTTIDSFFRCVTIGP